jgi:hypothetical protein
MARLLALALCCLPLGASADTHWLCGLSEDLTRLVCIADVDPRDALEVPVAAATAAAPAAPPTVVNGTRFPLDARIRYVVDLWSPPTEAAPLELLARATICYRSPGCHVDLTLPAYLRAQRH